MAWQMNSERPIYSQLYDKILVRIVCGIYKAGNRLPSQMSIPIRCSGLSPSSSTAG